MTTPLLTITQTAKLLHVHPNTLRIWDNKGILKAIRLGQRGDRKYNREDIIKLTKYNKDIIEFYKSNKGS